MGELRHLGKDDLKKCCGRDPIVVEEPLYEIKCSYCGMYVGGFDSLSIAVFVFNFSQQAELDFDYWGVWTDDGGNFYIDRDGRKPTLEMSEQNYRDRVNEALGIEDPN